MSRRNDGLLPMDLRTIARDLFEDVDESELDPVTRYDG